ncbi:thioester-forming surface-anchored protein [Corynebacterium cystitidis]|uniref:thioester-forming surface-anchored protein n=1 Tax=Corynebacterium cystitidis TaxID=35757 RepID=UPI00211ECA9B|nr:thioester-forming surface-anchored protein [Corynebacterium cystitidis]
MGHLTQTTTSRKGLGAIIVALMSVFALFASVLSAPQALADEGKYETFTFSAARADGMAPLMKVDGTVVYCYNIHRAAPRHGSQFKAIKKIATGDVFTESADSPRVTGEALEKNILEVLETGFGNDKLGLKAKYGLKDHQFYTVTQHAVWYYTDGHNIGYDHYTEDMREVSKILVQAQGAQMQRAKVAEYQALEIYLTERGDQQNLLSIKRVDKDTGKELEEGSAKKSSESIDIDGLSSGGEISKLSSVDGDGKGEGASSVNNEEGSAAAAGSALPGGLIAILTSVLGVSGTSSLLSTINGGTEGESSKDGGSSLNGDTTSGGDDKDTGSAVGSSGKGGKDGGSSLNGDTTSGGDGGSSGAAQCVAGGSSFDGPFAFLIPLGLLIAIGGSTVGLFAPQINALIAQVNSQFQQNMPSIDTGGSSVDNEIAGGSSAELAAVGQQLSQINPALGSAAVGALMVAIGVASSSFKWNLPECEAEFGFEGESSKTENVGSSKTENGDISNVIT